MIKDRNIDRKAGIQMSKILGPGQVGETFWLAGVDTKEYEILQDRVASDRLFVDSTEAINAMDADQGDVLFIAPNYTETIAGAAGLNIDKAGIDIICLGKGAVRPTFTFSATASTITITAASVTMKNFIIVPSIDSVVSPIVVSAADCTLEYEVQDASDTIECVNSLLTTAAADRLEVDCKYVGKIGGNACVNAIRLVGVDTARINVDFYGVASTSIVEFHTTACHNIVITGLFYNDGTSLTQNVVDTAGSSTWSVQGWDGNSNTNFTGGDNAAIANNVGELTGDADIDISEAVYTGYINIMTVTAPATGLSDCRIDIDVNKATTGWDTIATAADTIDVSLVGQVDGTNYRTIENATQITANGDGSLENNENGVSFHIGPLGTNESVQVHVKLSAERDDAELPYRVSYIGAAPTVTPVATA